MKLLIYSDLHLEFGSYFRLPEDTDADVLVLAGDIITFRDYDPLARLLEGRDLQTMETAHYQMNDFRLIRKADSSFLPSDTLALHERYVEKLLAWFEEYLSGPRVVISHHAPVINPRTQYMGSPLMPAFNSLDMQEIIEQHRPDLWIYGHTHECDDQTLGKTWIVSNQLGYPDRRGGFECAGFDERGMEIEVKK